MAQDPSETKSSSGPDLSDRVRGYAEAIVRVVTEVGEHPDYELKRSCSVGGVEDKIEFVKDVQSIATSRIATEKFLIIGADEQNHKFCPVANIDEFDEATLHQILSAHLEPVPVFEVFRRDSPNGTPYIFLVIRPQRSRMILAKKTVQHQGKQLLREGDLWTKGTGTGKRLANRADITEIVSELVDAEVTRLATVRAAHLVDAAVARKSVAESSGLQLLPPAFNDNNFKPLLEALCATNDEARFGVLIERLRDDLVESWGRLAVYGNEAESKAVPQIMAAEDVKQKLRENFEAVFQPALRSLMLAGLFTIKNLGPKPFLDQVSDLLQETFEVSHSLLASYSIALYGSRSVESKHIFTYLAPAVDAATACHILASYAAKRNRFQYFRSITRHEVYSAFWQGQDWKKRILAFWPIELGAGLGEATMLSEWGGRIRFCADQIRRDPQLGALFGSGISTIKAICTYEFCLELNSFLCFPVLSGEAGKYMERAYPNTDFAFRPEFYAFSLDNIRELAATCFSEVKEHRLKVLSEILWEPAMSTELLSPKGLNLIADFLNGIVIQQSQWFTGARRAFPPMFSWPMSLGNELKAFRDSPKK